MTTPANISITAGAAATFSVRIIDADTAQDPNDYTVALVARARAGLDQRVVFEVVEPSTFITKSSDTITFILPPAATAAIEPGAWPFAITVNLVTEPLNIIELVRGVFEVIPGLAPA